MKHILTIVTVLILLLLILPAKASAYSAFSAPSAKLTPGFYFNQREDKRVKVLYSYLEAQGSPLAEYAPVFVREADKNNIDWRLVAAISGLESGFGKHIPSNSYNGWGWGVYGDQVKRFSSWDEAISTISAGLRQNYINRLGTTDIYAIGQRYASSPTWAVRVESFVAKIDAHEEMLDAQDAAQLSLSI